MYHFKNTSFFELQNLKIGFYYKLLIIFIFFSIIFANKYKICPVLNYLMRMKKNILMMC